MSIPRALALVAFELPEADELFAWLGPRLEPVFGVRAYPVPWAVQARFDAVRSQYEAGTLLTGLAELAGPDWVLGVTSADLYMPVFTFVIGEAQLEGRAGVVSTYRLCEQRYGFAANPDRMRERLYKEAVHELGHCHGLTHCLDSRCIMFSSSGVEEVDLKGDELCPSCEAELRKRLAS